MSDDDQPADLDWLARCGWAERPQRPCCWSHPAAWMFTIDCSRNPVVLRLGDAAGGMKPVVINPSRGRLRLIAYALNLPIATEAS